MVLPAYVWPPRTWVDQAQAAQRFRVAYPPRLPKGSYFARYRIQSALWLSIPLQKPSRKDPLTATWPADSRWRLYHWRTLLTHFGKAPFFYEWKPFLEYLYLEARVATLRDFTDTILGGAGSALRLAVRVDDLGRGSLRAAQSRRTLYLSAPATSRRLTGETTGANSTPLRHSRDTHPQYLSHNRRLFLRSSR